MSWPWGKHQQRRDGFTTPNCTKYSVPFYFQHCEPIWTANTASSFSFRNVKDFLKKLFCLCLAVWSHSDKFPSVSKSSFQSLSCVWALARVDKDSTADAFPSAKDKLGCTKLDWSILTRLKIQTNTNQGMWSCDQLNQKANLFLNSV